MCAKNDKNTFTSQISTFVQTDMFLRLGGDIIKNYIDVIKGRFYGNWTGNWDARISSNLLLFNGKFSANSRIFFIKSSFIIYSVQIILQKKFKFNIGKSQDLIIKSNAIIKNGYLWTLIILYCCFIILQSISFQILGTSMVA